MTFRDQLKFRARMALALCDTPPEDTATPAELDHLVLQQLAYWHQHRPLNGSVADSALKALNERSISTFVLTIRGRNVTLQPKSVPMPAGYDSDLWREQQRSFLRRALHYRTFIERALRRAELKAAFEIALDVNDFSADSAAVPIFGFQKPHGAKNILLPDVDFFHERWYRKQRDALAYEQKSNSACFVGSSTGAWLTVEVIRRGQAPRLRAAAHFQGNPRVMFRIAKAVGCDSDEARALLQSQAYFGEPVSWSDQLRHRFLISMDGNGAACSRLVRGLLSHSVVLKFESPHELYYFPALEPGTHYLSIREFDDIERILDAEAADAGRFKPVSEAGNRFARKYLTIRSVMDYTARLLRAYASLAGR